MALLAVLCVGAAQAASPEWLPLDKDGVHDPKAPGLRTLQQPAEALSKLPPDTAGNQVRWVRALDEGAINPRPNLKATTPVRLREDDILLNLKGGQPVVRFPHRQHTLWLDCVNCHDHLFLPKAGANKISMFAILSGEQCGVCHGAVSFPLTECNRCHSVPRNKLKEVQEEIEQKKQAQAARDAANPAPPSAAPVKTPAAATRPAAPTTAPAKGTQAR